jgi:hypothetical protein
VSDPAQDHASEAVLPAPDGGDGMSVSAAWELTTAPAGCVAVGESVVRFHEEDQL